MKGTIELTPDQLANLVAAVFEANGLKAYGLALHLKDQLVGYDRVVVHYEALDSIKVFPPPQVTPEKLNSMLYPHERFTGFGSRQPSGVAVG